MKIETTARSKLTMAGGTDVDVETFEIGSYKVTKLTNTALPERAWCVYVYDAPHVNFDAFIEDTKTLGIRSIETILQASNVLIAQRNLFSDQTDFLSASIIPSIVEHYSSETMADNYIEAINGLLPDTNYGFLAQGNGFGVMSWILTKKDQLNTSPKYIYLSSPILEPNNAFALLSYRRDRVLTRNHQLRSLLDNNPVMNTLKGKVESQGRDQAKIHKLAKSIAHPSHPIGLIGINVEKEIEYLADFSGENLSDWFDYTNVDPINFIMDSHYLTPGSNVAKVKKELIKTSPYETWMMDEYRFECDEYDTSDGLQCFMDYNAITRLFPENWLKTLTHCATLVPTHIAFDSTDIAVPFEDCTNEFLIAMDDFAVLHEREGYGHWVGHSLIRRVNGKLAA